MRRLLEQILSLNSRLYLMKDFRMQESNEKVTKVVSLCKNDRKEQMFPYFSDLPWRCIHHLEIWKREVISL